MLRKNGNRKGFSLVELVVVILIMGILAAVAAPKMFDKANDAKINGTKQSLAALRDAIELYKADNGSYPPDAATLPAALRTYLKGPFPKVQMGAHPDSADIAAGTATPLTPGAGGEGWIYYNGEIAINDAIYIND